MLNLIFTSDYEIHGNGEGDPSALMVEPTDRMLALFDQYGAKLTIMADVAEILQFKSHLEKSGRDDFAYRAVVQQLRRAVLGGHDVQLHIHSSYFNARQENGRWAQDWSEYNFAGLRPERMDWMVRTCKNFLEGLLQPVVPSYRCVAFRAANWSVSPSANVVAALTENDLKIDTSVFKFGRRQGVVTFDYSGAHHHLRPWRADAHDLCRENPAGALWECPIYAEQRPVMSFLTLNRIYRAAVGRFHKIADGPGASVRTRSPQSHRWTWLFRKHSWKADFNQCSGRQLIGALRAAERENVAGAEIPFVLIGHSKLFTRWNERSLKPLLRFVRQHPRRFVFGTFERFLEGAPKAAPARFEPVAV